MRWCDISLLMFVVFATACSSSPSPVLPPLKLAPIQNDVKIEQVWRTQVGEGASDNYLKFAPAIAHNKGYVVDHKGHVRAFAVATGSTVWEVDLKLPISTRPNLTNGKILLGTSQGEVLALNKDNGKIIWRASVSSEVLSAPRGAQDIVVVRTVDGHLYGLDANSGQRRWVYERSVPTLTLRGTSGPVIVNDMIISGADNGRLVALTLKNGTVLWETAIAVPRGRTELERMIDIDADPIVIDDVIYVVSFQGRIAMVQLDSGRVLWTRDVSAYSGMSVDPYRLYLSDSEGRVWALDRASGATLWKQDKLLRRALTAPTLQGQYVVVGDFNGFLHWLSREDGHLVARIAIEDMDKQVDSEEDLLFSKSSNILAAPVAIEDNLIVIGRTGNMVNYRITGL